MKIRRYIDSLDQDASVRVPIEFELTSDEILEAYWEQQHFYDIADVENELREQWDVYAEKYYFDLYGFCLDDITEEDIEMMAADRKYRPDEVCGCCGRYTPEGLTICPVCALQIGQQAEKTKEEKTEWQRKRSLTGWRRRRQRLFQRV